MKNLFIKIVSLLIIVLILTTSCKKTGATGATGAAGPASGPLMTGNIEGLVSLYDAGSIKQLGASVNTGDSIILTNNGNGAVYKTITSSTGTYTFSNVTSGTYSFTVSKPGYGTVKAFGFEFVGGGTTYKSFNLGQIPSTNIVSIAATTNNTSISINGTYPSSTGTTWIITFVSLPSNNFVNGTFGNYSDYSAFANGPSTSPASFGVTFPASTFYGLGFTSGSTVFFASYIYSTNSVYQDPLTGLNIYTALSNTPAITSAIVP